MSLPITRATLYKHGLGFFERAGRAEAHFTLSFPRRAMDDALKSLAVLTLEDGAQVLGVAFETPPDRNPEAQRQALQFSADTPVSDVIEAFAGSRAMVFVGDRSLVGEIIGLERESEHHLERALLAIAGESGIELLPLSSISRVALLDERAQADLEFALSARRRDEERASASVTLSAPSQVAIQYIAPAPAWRVSYRLLSSEVEGNPEARDIYVQGWGLFDNTLEEDLENVELTLTAGMPVSFRYELHAPNTPDRPLVRDESRTLSAPVKFDAMPAESYAMPAPAPAMAAGAAPRRMKSAAKPTAEQYAQSAPVQASGESRGALFAYKIATPVSVKRGESGMVPILGFKTRGSRELLYNPNKTAEHPTASLRFQNQNLTLEHGPCTVLDNGEYAGEAIVSFTPGGAEVILAFAVELGIGMRQQSSSREELRRIALRDGSLFMDITEYLETTYEASSQLESEVIITLEHPRWYNATLLTTAVEHNQELARFKFPVAARKTVQFKVEEQRSSSRYQEVLGLDGQLLAQYVQQNLLDQATAQKLRAILERQASISDLERRLNENETQRERLRKRMDDTRNNLAPLDAVQDTKLRKRLVTQLETLEDEMGKLDSGDEQMRQDIARLEAENSAALKALI